MLGTLKHNYGSLSLARPEDCRDERQVSPYVYLPLQPASPCEIPLQRRKSSLFGGRSDVSVISPTDAHSLKSPVLWVDCRDDAERAVSVINVDAISEKEFRKQRHRVEDTAVIAYCTIGYRSAQFCSQTPGAVNLEGGIVNWINAGYPIWGPNGEPSNRVHVWSEQFKEHVPEGFSAVVYSKAAVALQLPRILLRNVTGL